MFTVSFPGGICLVGRAWSQSWSGSYSNRALGANTSFLRVSSSPLGLCEWSCLGTPSQCAPLSQSSHLGGQLVRAVLRDIPHFVTEPALLLGVGRGAPLRNVSLHIALATNHADVRRWAVLGEVALLVALAAFRLRERYWAVFGEVALLFACPALALRQLDKVLFQTSSLDRTRVVFQQQRDQPFELSIRILSIHSVSNWNFRQVACKGQNVADVINRAPRGDWLDEELKILVALLVELCTPDLVDFLVKGLVIDSRGVKVQQPSIIYRRRLATNT